MHAIFCPGDQFSYFSLYQPCEIITRNRSNLTDDVMLLAASGPSWSPQCYLHLLWTNFLDPETSIWEPVFASKPCQPLQDTVRTLWLNHLQVRWTSWCKPWHSGLWYFWSLFHGKEQRHCRVHTGQRKQQKMEAWLLMGVLTQVPWPRRCVSSWSSCILIILLKFL